MGEWEVCGKRLRVEDESRSFEDEKQKLDDIFKNRYYIGNSIRTMNSGCYGSCTCCNWHYWFFGISPVAFKKNCDRVDLVIKLNLVKLRMIECFGEAIPQLLIAIVFCARHYEWVKVHDQLFGFAVPGMTIVTIIFSFGSIAYGIYSEGIPLFCGSKQSEGGNGDENVTQNDVVTTQPQINDSPV